MAQLGSSHHSVFHDKWWTVHCFANPEHAKKFRLRFQRLARPGSKSCIEKANEIAIGRFRISFAHQVQSENLPVALAVCDLGGRELSEDEAEPAALTRGAEHRAHLVENEPSVHVNGYVLAADTKFPFEEPRAVQAMTDAIVFE